MRRRITDRPAAGTPIAQIRPVVDLTTVALARGLALALAGGALIGALARAVEVSRLELGPYALYGNGALAVPAVLTPLAIFAGWTVPLRRRGQPWVLSMVLHLLGLALGMALGQLVLGGDAQVGLAMGAIFLVPSAVVAAITILALRRVRITVERSALVTAFVASLLVPAVPAVAALGGLGASGIAVGVSAAYGSRESVSVRVALGSALLALMLISVFVVPLLFGPR